MFGLITNLSWLVLLKVMIFSISYQKYAIVNICIVLSMLLQKKFWIIIKKTKLLGINM